MCQYGVGLDATFALVDIYWTTANNVFDLLLRTLSEMRETG